MSMIDWTSVISETLSGLIVGGVLAVLGYVFIDHYMQSIAFSKKMSEYGFSNVSLERQSGKEVRQICEEADLIKIINVSGMHFLNDNRPYILNALARGCSICFLCANPGSQFLSDIENMEFNTFDDSGRRLRGKDDKIGREVEMLTSEYLAAGMHIKYFSSEYRLPFVIARYPDGSKKAWLTMTLPPYKSTRSFVLRGQLEKGTVYSSELNFIEMMETNFDTIWNYGSVDASSCISER